MLVESEPVPTVGERQRYSRVMNGASADDFEVAARELDHRRVEFDDRNPANARVFEPLFECVPVTAYDDKNVLGAATRERWHMHWILMVVDLVTLRHRGDPVDAKNAEFGLFQDFQHLPFALVPAQNFADVVNEARN